MNRTRALTLSLAALALSMAGISMLSRRMIGPQPPSVRPPGRDKSLRTRALETGAWALQRTLPLHGFDVYVAGFHPMKDHPEHQCEAHHFCRQVNQDFMECVLFDGNQEDANLTGIEYIISERLFERLPEAERRFWHPHNGEILSGQLVAPGLPAAAEHALMGEKMNSYGKTWHLWDTGTLDRRGDELPMGEPMLAWSFSRDGEILPELLERRDRRLGIATEDRRRTRQDLIALAHPQWGVDALKGRFPRPTQDIPGVRDRQSATVPENVMP